MKQIILIVSLIILTGCSTVSNRLPDKVSDKMQECTKKKTTLAEIFCKKK